MKSCRTATLCTAVVVAYKLALMFKAQNYIDRSNRYIAKARINLQATVRRGIISEACERRSSCPLRS
eukprot:6194466-Pleurochrysis_carterae.AAC.1